MTGFRILRKAVLIIFFLLLGIEIVLQLASQLISATSREVPDGWSTQHTRVLALGDSNTFGLYLKEEESYPSQLEALWNERHPENPIEVLNLGYPGTNSFGVASNLEEVMTAFKPELVLLTIGTNDIFTAAEYIGGDSVPGADTQPRDPMKLLRRYSRLYKLVYMVAQGLKSGGSSPNQNDGGTTGESPIAVKNRDLLTWTDDNQERMGKIMEFKAANTEKSGDPKQQGETISFGNKKMLMIAEKNGPEDPGIEKGFHYLKKNLENITNRLAEQNIDFYLLTYAASEKMYRKPNVKMREFVAKNNRTPFIDVAANVAIDCPVSSNCPELFFGDLHPTAEGYQKVAEIVAKRLEQDKALTR